MNIEWIKICDSIENNQAPGICSPKQTCIVNDLNNCRDGSVEANKTWVDVKTKLKSSRSLSKLWKGYSLKFSDWIMPVRQSHKEINRDLPQKQTIRSKHLINHQRVKIDISKPNITNIDGKAKNTWREIKAKKFSLPVNWINQALSKTKLIKLDINSKDLKVIDSSKERVCETSNSSIERPKNFKGIYCWFRIN